ncbi:MAG: FG-GAP repeat domain-containing protein [Marinicellaceae bacterium]
MPQFIHFRYFLILFVSSFACSQDWVTFEEVTDDNIQITPDLGVDDTFEKDLFAADLDNDGDADMIIVRKERFSTPGGLPNVLAMNESGIFVDKTASLAPGFLDSEDDRDVIAVDVDNDGWLDVVTVTTFGDTPRVYMNLGNDVNNSWQGLSYIASDNRIIPFLIAPKFCAIAAGDVNGDNFPDLFLADYANDLEDRLLINDGNGFFIDETETRMSAAMSESVFGTSTEIFDMNGDGFRDIVKVSSSGSSPPPGSTPPNVRVIYNDGTGNFTQMNTYEDLDPYMMELIDVNKDNKMDLFIVSDFQDKVMLNKGNDKEGYATFLINDINNSANTEDFGGNTFTVDLNKDGFDDMLVADVDTDIMGCDRFLVGLQNNNGNSLTDPLDGESRDWLTQGTFDISVADFNGDGFQDLWSGTCDGNRLFFQVPPGLIFKNSFEENSN